MSLRDGEILHQQGGVLVIRGKFSADEVQRLTGKVGSIYHQWLRSAYRPDQRIAFATSRGNYCTVSPYGSKRGAFIVTVLNIAQQGLTQ